MGRRVAQVAQIARLRQSRNELRQLRNQLRNAKTPGRGRAVNASASRSYLRATLARLAQTASEGAIPSFVLWSYLAFGAIFVLGIAALLVRGEWRRARGIERLLLFAPLFFAAPIAAFGAEHFTVTEAVASIVPGWIPWHAFWVYLTGACFLAAAASLATGVLARPAALALGATFLAFVLLVHGPAWVQAPRDRFALAVALRETAFSGGALALAASLTGEARGRKILATLARFFIAAALVYFSVQQFRHADFVPAIPLKRPTPAYIVGGPLWTYLAAVVYAGASVSLLIGKKTRAAALAAGLTVLAIELAVYLPIGVVDRASLSNGLNYVADTLLFDGAILLLAGAMPRK